MFNIQFPKHQQQTIAVKLKPSSERMLLQSAHPWIYSDSIDSINREGQTGDIAILFRQKTNKIMGVGLYDPETPIKIKMLHYYSGAKIDKPFLEKLIQNAFALRQPLLKTQTNSYRLIFGENDGFPNLIVDVYAQVAVIQLHSKIWIPYLETISELIIEITKCSTLVLRLNRYMLTMNNVPFHDGQVLYGTLDNEVVIFKEHGILFSANVIKGHKTGYFLDHRENRRRVGALSKGKTMLDVFAYAGGFSVHALAGGAKEVTSVDISKQALDLAKENAKLNKFSGKHVTIAGDAFEILDELRKKRKQFDIVVIDPPSFVNNEAGIDIALKKYRQLARLGAALVAPKGYLVLASCSSRVSAEQFFSEVQREVYASPHKSFKLLEHTFHDIDHPVTFKEGAYLKCGYYKREK